MVSGCLRVDKPAPRPRLDQVRTMRGEPSGERERIPVSCDSNLDGLGHPLSSQGHARASTLLRDASCVAYDATRTQMSALGTASPI